MKSLQLSDVFETLNKTKHITPQVSPTLDIFKDDNTHTTIYDNEYWHYSDLHNLFGDTYFSLTPNMDANVYRHIYMPKTPIPKRGQIELTPTDTQFHDEHVIPIHHSFTLGYNHYRNATDLELSRYTCWCLTRQSPQQMFSRLYFLHPNITFIELYRINHEYRRIELRNILSGLEKQLNGILYRLNANFGVFNHETIRPFFGGYKSDELRDMHNIKNKTAPLMDYVGPLTLMARINALDTTLRTYNRTQYQMSVSDLSYTLGDELIRQRRILKYELKTYPESDINPNTPIQKLQRQLNNIEQNFIKEYANKKLRQLTK